MSQKLKQAIAATRAGQSKEAQILLAQVLQENPSNTQAWYLLSLLVDSPSKKQAYLNKVVALDPTHEKAQQALVQLHVLPEVAEVGEVVEETAVSTPPPAIPAIDDETDFTAEAVEEPIPDWLADVQPVVTETEADVFTEVEPSSPEEIPDWLTGATENGWVESEQPTLVSEQKPENSKESASEYVEDSPTIEDESILAALSDVPEPAKTSTTPLNSGAETTTTPAKKQSSTAIWDRVLWILIALAIITLLAMVYLILG